MSGRRNLKSTSGLLGVTGLTLATLAFAWGHPETASSLVQKGEDGACVIARIAEARAATGDNMGAKPKPAAADACNPCGGCNPCAGDVCNPCAAANCNPCTAADACNPCAAAACNPCNPCGGCNPCNPGTGSAESMELSGEEIRATYGCLKGEMKAAYGMSSENGASEYQDWANYNTQPYISATHGGRYVNNYANAAAGAYGKFEDAGPMPVGAILAKDSLTIDDAGKAAPGPLFLMEKMEIGFDPDFGEWKYTLILPDGTTWGVTNGKNSAGMKFCSDCHIAAEDFDFLFFMPDEFRKK
ncbi:MAG: hypothetical protein IH995_07315 [Proteobacteria bacterium]|nr:hypothetical protein [Pseudomonadota bacterium]